jgi:hypothetical protein
MHIGIKKKILLRCWSNTWQKKNTKKKQNSHTPNPQHVQSFSTPRYTEKTGGMPCLHTPVPNLFGGCRPTVRDSEGNKENGYQVPDPNKTKIDYPTEPNEAYQKAS